MYVEMYAASLVRVHGEVDFDRSAVFVLIWRVREGLI